MAAPKENKVGRPLDFKTAEELQEKIDEYFKSDDAHFITEDGNRTPAPTMSGLAMYLGLSRQGLVNYSYRDEFVDTVKKARSRVEQYLERRLYGNNVTGVIFSLKNNFNWADRQEIYQETKEVKSFDDMYDE